MKNTFTTVCALTLVILAAVGCGSLNPLSREMSAPTPSPGSNSGTDSVVTQETTGVPECDEVMDMIAAEANSPDDGYVVKAIKTTFLNRIKDGIRQAVEESRRKSGNANSAADLRKTCRDFKEQLIKYKSQEAGKKTQ